MAQYMDEKTWMAVLLYCEGDFHWLNLVKYGALTEHLLVALEEFFQWEDTLRLVC